MNNDTAMELEAKKEVSLRSRALRFGRSMIVGTTATAVDLVCMEIFVRLVELRPSTAKIPAFLIALSVQFFGNRTFTFNASRGSLGRQMALFAAVEGVTLTLHWLLARLFIEILKMPLEVGNILLGFLVYSCFSYPAWAWIFRGEQPGGGKAG